MKTDFGPRTEKVNVRVHKTISTRNRCTLRRHGMYIRSVCTLEPSNLIETSETELPKFVQSLVENYNELSADGILTEIPRLRRSLKAVKFQKKSLLVVLP
ncbi:hypothetical protein AVEN_37663-1 [Araneus ventricosus]|uniref:Uncharacterized protein n=1 Tax=Araneus ventricosus TaxID=182803 RepID=A0A4Y1ZV15_ARAVE|nr:hypothetical protein AVEN_37663-1 [Araneus ventricosus]